MRLALSRSVGLVLSVVLGGLGFACGSGGDDRIGVDVADDTTDPLEAAARAKLRLAAQGIDDSHLRNYKLDGSTADQFVEAVKLEYGATPELATARLQTLASMVFFGKPEEATDPTIGKVTPFHGMDTEAFDALKTNEDFVFDHHMRVNNHSPKGVRPFSVCETTFLIGLSKGTITGDYVSGRRILNYDGYAKAYQEFAATCPRKDLDEWYNYRGLGGLRPSWLESNISERVLRKMLKDCRNPSALNKEKCDEFLADRLKYRDKKNTELALRTMVYDPNPETKIGDVSAETYMCSPRNGGLFVEDRNGDGIAEWIAPGEVTGATPDAAIKSNGQWIPLSELSSPRLSMAGLSGNKFAANLTVSGSKSDGTYVSGTIAAQYVQAHEAVDPSWSKDYLSRPDLGLLEVFKDREGCMEGTITPQGCPLLRRFYSMIDRHEDFYSTYTSTDERSPGVSSQPSPLVACSITLAAANSWARAGAPSGSPIGFIYLMRIPFEQILTSDERSIDTLGLLESGGDLKAGPKVLHLKEIYEGTQTLDMSKVWLDIATLSNNQYSSEHEVSKYGSVPAEQIEGILVVGTPSPSGGAPEDPDPTPWPTPWEEGVDGGDGSDGGDFVWDDDDHASDGGGHASDGGTD